MKPVRNAPDSAAAVVVVAVRIGVVVAAAWATGVITNEFPPVLWITAHLL
jgi:nucleoside phosphorylase